MSFKDQGFRSETMDAYRKSLRNVAEYKAWFEFAEMLIGFGLSTSETLSIPRDIDQKSVVALLFIRSLKSFQAAIVLCETGLIGDARTILRSAVENAIAIRSLSIDADFLVRLRHDKLIDDRKKARVLTQNPAQAALLSAAELGRLQTTIKLVDDFELTAGRLKSINWVDEALKKDDAGEDGRDLYDLLYRSLSSDGTHTTIDAIYRLIDFDESKQKISEVKAGPDITNLVGTVAAACNIFLWSVVAVNQTYGCQLDAEIQKFLAQFCALPDGEPEVHIS